MRERRGAATAAIGLLAGLLILGLPQESARSSDADPPLDLPPGFAADVFAGGLGSPRALAVDPVGHR